LAEGFTRHDLVRVEPRAWAAWLETRADLNGLRHVCSWAEAARPLIVRRLVPGETGDDIPLGLPLPPADGKRRLGLALPANALERVPPPSLADVAGDAPSQWLPTIGTLVALGRDHRIPPRPFGSLLWQSMTGLTYLSASSDLDLLWPCPGAVPASLLDRLGAIADAAPMRIDGEILLSDGTGLHWRELRDAPDGGSVLAKSVGGLAMVDVGPLRTGAPV
jgi:phosphoribosyl-dephospho-CoA transferase